MIQQYKLCKLSLKRNTQKLELFIDQFWSFFGTYSSISPSKNVSELPISITSETVEFMTVMYNENWLEV